MADISRRDEDKQELQLLYENEEEDAKPDNSDEYWS